MIHVTETISLDEDTIQEDFIRASGPGGQKVNKTATAVQLRFDLPHAALPDDVRERLIKLAGNRITEDGMLIIEARRFRTQQQNRDDALARLVRLIRQAAHPPKRRRNTQPPAASRRRRLADKRHRSKLKKLRRVDSDEKDT
ncbi:aminoacyl-tRNA hydrolase [candidate division KSB3 bacterium]|uniref:Aminoacyl-tRNA hydrolase n=1 Tax=candidate division KSB3 bacterium TaxID=2044937 RepID=A0A9D5JYE2_9BACT|nr:aminoacyl-tRNA hydrolase [candidate division KSB3 bacterium]MBD3326107.1 aminoacyl-tRNA hydrolase [candidate division KSB3 bacterium]